MHFCFMTCVFLPNRRPTGGVQDAGGATGGLAAIQLGGGLEKGIARGGRDTRARRVRCPEWLKPWRQRRCAFMLKA